MLQTIRDRAQGVFAWVMLIAVGIPFALWGIQNYIDTGTETPAAVVGDREIMDKDVTRAYEQSLSSLVGIADFDEKKMKHEALEHLIKEEVIAQTAEKKALTADDDQVRALIQTLPYFQTDGKFDKEKYKIMLSAQGMSANQFAAQIRKALVMEQVQHSLLDTAFVTKDQLGTLLRLKKQERDVEYATVSLKASTRVISDAEIESYYQARRADFRNEEKVSIDYLSVSLDDIAKTVQVTDEDLHKLYDEQKANFGSPERRKLSHILITLDDKTDLADNGALAKITNIKQRLANGEDFAKLASEASADSVSAKKGGELGYLDKDAQEESFSKAAMSLKLGEVSEPIKTSFGYHLIKLTELLPATTKSFDEVKSQLLKTAQQNAAESRFYDIGQKLTEQAYEHPDSLEPAANQLGLTIQSTGVFTRDAGEGIAMEESVRKAAFTEEVLQGRNSDPIEMSDNKALVLRIKDHQPASDKPLEEVKARIIALLRDQDARAAAAKTTEALLAEVRAGKQLTEVAKNMNLPVVKVDSVRRDNDKLPSELVVALFKASRPTADKPSFTDVILENGDQLVIAVTAIKDGVADAKDTQEQASASQFVVRSEGQREFGSFVDQLRQLADVTVRAQD
ncbi:MAG: SurA N-terminal domain-containing protein [Methylococcaceae bacterium]|jgi:peptidyl-prolyl cis-trans isomerase D